MMITFQVLSADKIEKIKYLIGLYLIFDFTVFETINLSKIKMIPIYQTSNLELLHLLGISSLGDILKM